VRHPELALAIDNGLTLCAECHYYEAHHGWPAWIHGRYSLTRRPFPGQLALFARWPGPLFAAPRSLLPAVSPPPPIDTVWPGPQRLLFPLSAGIYAEMR
jgi:hypothetical protein